LKKLRAGTVRPFPNFVVPYRLRCVIFNCLDSNDHADNGIFVAIRSSTGANDGGEVALVLPSRQAGELPVLAVHRALARSWQGVGTHLLPPIKVSIELLLRSGIVAIREIDIVQSKGSGEDPVRLTLAHNKRPVSSRPTGREDR
jgi:hypothetical protein